MMRGCHWSLPKTNRRWLYCAMIARMSWPKRCWNYSLKLRSRLVQRSKMDSIMISIVKRPSEDDLATIEKRMHEIVDRDESIIRNVWTRDEAVAFYKKNNEPFKIELVEAIPADQTVTFYQQGDFIDLCRGPHLPSTGKLGHAFKLMKVAGAYWRGDSTRPMLQRIYGTAWVTEKDLAAYLHMLKEAEKRDHRKLGRQLGLFHLQEEAAGSVFWHAKGWVLYREIEAYVRRRLDAAGYS